MGTPKNEFIWTSEKLDRFTQMLNAQYTEEYYQVMVEEFGAPSPTEDYDKYIAWQKRAITSYLLHNIAQAQSVEIINEELDPFGEGKLFQLGFIIDGQIHHVISDIAIQCKDAIEKRLAENTPKPPTTFSTADAHKSKFDARLQKMFNEVAQGTRDPNEVITVIMRTDANHAPVNMTIRSGEGREVKTAEGTLESIEKLKSDPKVKMVETPKKLGLV